MGFKKLIISNLKNDLQNDLIGCILYLLKDGQRNGIGYVPVRFINPLSSKIKMDIIKYLMNLGLIVRYKPKEDYDVDNSGSNLKYLESGKKEWEKKPNLYKLSDPTFLMPEGYTSAGTETILRNLHNLNDMAFNHYYYNYRNIKVNIPESELMNVINLRTVYYLGNEKTVRISNQDEIGLEMWGDKSIYPYVLDRICIDDNLGSHRNFFSHYGYDGIKYSSLINPMLIGPKYPDAIILADQLLKTFPNNDFSNYFKIRKHQKPLIKNNKVISQYGEPLFYHWRDYDFYTLFDDQIPDKKFKQYFPNENLFDLPLYSNTNKELGSLGELRFKTAIYGWETITYFRVKFPETWKILHRIKCGTKYQGKDFDNYLELFCRNIVPAPNLKSPILHINDPEGKYGRTYYKVIYYVIKNRENKINRQIWKRLKKCDIIFIPLGPYIAVSEKDLKVAEFIVFEEWLKAIDKTLKVLFSSFPVKKD